MRENNLEGIWVSEEGRGEGAPGVAAEIPLQVLADSMSEQAGA